MEQQQSNTAINPLAFPQEIIPPYGDSTGMSLRDYFAAKVMQGIVCSIDSEENYVRLAEHAQSSGLGTVSAWIARESYKQADAMLAARAKAGAR